MKTWLPSPRREFSQGEFSAVIGLAFGLAILGSLSAMGSYGGQAAAITDDDLSATILYELLMAAIITAILRARGWKWSDFDIGATQGATVMGVVLAIVVLVQWLLIEAMIGKVPAVLNVSTPWVVAASAINPLFEEVLVLGYVLQATRKRFGIAAGINVSIAIRVLYHVYQGPQAVLPIAAMGAIVALAYVRLGRLWPAIVAHAILNFIALEGWFQ